MDLKEYKKKYKGKDASPGWDCIDDLLNKRYGDQEPKHFATTIKHSMGGEDPLDGISIYQSNSGGIEHFHIVTYGFSELYYNEEAVNEDFSKFGFELSFRLKPYADDGEFPIWALNMLQNIARYVFSSGNWFEENHYLNAKGPIRQDCDTNITALAFCIDPELETIDTPHGEVQFLQVYGLTNNEFEAINSRGDNAESLLQQHKTTNPLLITDLARKD